VTTKEERIVQVSVAIGGTPASLAGRRGKALTDHAVDISHETIRGFSAKSA
jgi:hypothetical protein